MPKIIEEAQRAIGKIFFHSESAGVPIPAYDTLLDIVARTSARLFVCD